MGLRVLRIAIVDESDRAKAILMKSRGLAEPDVYNLLRTTAMNQGRKIAAVSEALITASALLDGGKP